jgi:hypothetical protein
MLKVALEYQVAINAITADKSFGVRNYELEKDEWDILVDLVRVLKVSFPSLFLRSLLTPFLN